MIKKLPFRILIVESRHVCSTLRLEK